MRWVAVLLLISACAPAPISVTARYPAGTPFVARTVQVLGTSVRFIDEGSGVPVLLVHGVGESMYAWRHNLGPLVAAGYRVIAFDNRGSGFSGKPDTGYTNLSYDQLLLGLMDALGLPDAVLVGHSMGGEIAAEVALSAPRRVRGLVLIDAAGEGVRAPWLLHLAGVLPVAQVALAVAPRWSVTLALRSTYANPRLITPEDINQYYAPVRDPGFSHALAQVLAHFRVDALRGRLGGLETPTLVLWGSRDRLMPQEFGARFASELPRSAFVVVPGAGHDLEEEAPDRVNDLLLTFLKQGVAHAPQDLAVARSIDQR
jgi:pimeloyl-ACP methyl ester carboxylesterase